MLAKKGNKLPTCAIERVAATRRIAKQILDLELLSRKEKYGKAKKIISNAQLIYPWIDRHKISYQIKLMKLNAEEENNQGLTSSTICVAPPTAGRPVGTTKDNKLLLEQKKSNVVASIAVEYHNLKKSSPAKLPDHTLHNLTKFCLH